MIVAGTDVYHDTDGRPCSPPHSGVPVRIYNNILYIIIYH
eukprot:COSAG06_NODE_48899_length_329_cov_0.617391_2_plen_39_part_01